MILIWFLIDSINLGADNSLGGWNYFQTTNPPLDGNINLRINKQPIYQWTTNKYPKSALKLNAMKI